jgi:DNA-binding CsgD family transcriptional regulator
MEQDRVQRLSEGQRECLRMVLLHMSSKDIARALDISPHTVDQRLKLAMKALGAPTRVEAARLLPRPASKPPACSPRPRGIRVTKAWYTKARTLIRRLPAPHSRHRQ